MAKRNKNKNNQQYVELYSQAGYTKDEHNFDNAIKNGTSIDFSGFKRLMLHDLCTHTSVIETGCIGDIKLKDVEVALKSPLNNWKLLLAVSNQLMRVSPHYYRMNQYYSNMPVFCWGIDLYDIRDNVNISDVKKRYNVLAAKLENMNLKHEFNKIMKYLPYQDIFCGLIIESNIDFFVQRVDYDICKLCQIQDGLYNFAINLSAVNPKNLNAYPDYLQQAYLDYHDGKISSNWYLPPADKQICIKLNSQWTYPYPILLGMVRDILDLDTYKKLKLQSARTDNYKAIMIKVPIDETTIDKPLLTPKTLEVFAEINRENMNDDIGLLYTLGSNGEAISFKDSNNTTNNVSDAIDEIYNSSGISKEMFNGSSNATAMSMSAENDAGMIYGIYRQFERWTNRYIKLKKYNKTAFKFYFYLLDITIFNRDNVSKRYKEAATLGLPVVDKLLASLDMTPARVSGSYIIHNDIFDYYNKFKPLSSTYNAAIESGENGRPTNESQGKSLSEEGEKTADGDKNDR